MLSRGRVIRTCDVTLKNNLLYNLLDLDISAVIDEHIDKLIKTLEVLELLVTALMDNDNLIKTFTSANLLKASKNYPKALVNLLLIPTSLLVAPKNTAH